MCLPNLEPTWTWKAGLDSSGLWCLKRPPAALCCVGQFRAVERWVSMSLWGHAWWWTTSSQQTGSVRARRGKAETRCCFLRHGPWSAAQWYGTSVSMCRALSPISSTAKIRKKTWRALGWGWGCFTQAEDSMWHAAQHSLPTEHSKGCQPGCVPCQLRPANSHGSYGRERGRQTFPDTQRHSCPTTGLSPMSPATNWSILYKRVFPDRYRMSTCPVKGKWGCVWRDLFDAMPKGSH